MLNIPIILQKVKKLRGKLRNRFLTLLLEKEVREQRRISRQELIAATGVALTTIIRWEKNEIVKFDSSVVEVFCDYLDCDLSDLLYLEPESEQN